MNPKHTKIIKNSLVIIGGFLSCVGIIFVTLAVVLSFVSFQEFERISTTLIQLGPILVLSGFSIAMFFGSWLSIPGTGLRKVLLGLLFNQITGILFLGGLLVGLIGYYWKGDEQIGRFGFACYLLGCGLILIKISTFKMVVDRKVDSEYDK